MCEEFIKEGIVVRKLIKFTQCLGNKALTNDQKKVPTVKMRYPVSCLEWHLPWLRSRQNVSCSNLWKVDILLPTFTKCLSQNWRHRGDGDVCVIWPLDLINLVPLSQPASFLQVLSWSLSRLRFLLSEAEPTFYCSYRNRVRAWNTEVNSPSAESISF